ncbi:DivIVA domain-containing protein [Intestinibacter bartlettii]|uniref:DivIVA domain-containing protein n=1 Tax=Intestinibacter bartlettii TaxID=261299 RepID=A0ABS6DVH1_9FIRM|nr:DivIVA domain-containing protein [Intestinibacter bartlettii]MBU5335833.1 DivIVA domain-containing protein [Intestinibacter bartlettii]
MITPIEIQNKEFRRGFRGYSEDEVDDFLKVVTDDFESLYKENMDLKEKVKLYQEQVSRYKSIEETLNATLITAQSAAEDTCVAANKKAKIIVEEAQLQSKHIIDETNNRILELKKEYDNLVREFKVFRNRFKSLIKEELDTLDEIFYDVDESCEMPFRECNYIKEDIEDTADLFTEEIAVEEDSDVNLSKNNEFKDDNSADE